MVVWNIQVDHDLMSWILGKVVGDYCIGRNCSDCPFSAGNNEYNKECDSLTGAQKLIICKKLFADERKDWNDRFRKTED